MESSLSTLTRVNNAFRSVFKLPGLELLVARITSGRVPASALARLAPNHYQYRSGSRRQVRRSGVELDLDISDFVDWYAYYGLVDPGQDVWFEHIEPNQVVVDVGANNGYLSLRLAQRVGPGGKVIAFEPHPANVARCRANHSLNAMEHLELVPLGLGDAEGETTMIEVRAANAGMNRMVATEVQVAEAARETEMAHETEAAHETETTQPAESLKAPGTTVRVTTLDRFFQARSSLSVDWIKIDVEGYEARVLRGAAATIARRRPGLFIEVDDSNLRAQGDSAAGLLKWVEDAGYEIRDAATGQPIPTGSALEGCHFDVLCLHTERSALPSH